MQKFEDYTTRGVTIDQFRWKSVNFDKDERCRLKKIKKEKKTKLKNEFGWLVDKFNQERMQKTITVNFAQTEPNLRTTDLFNNLDFKSEIAIAL